ncbi:uncharacterized protein MONOS_4086 [Monocercomonoides exilis]|uniref:uncharacterized protein n=1 Tax=Monocercomonoides exilis TaxID=2049356 RepID=UPI003559833A|nr:hypothetical protein MONOS_4086 [Monocercomonoides exilis]|eukprot:MONOS_4086.1-p1 / transcript=MONOS_4086.1 / gene=MONOS_4086 / organism=Monocercomonoides_exilis_PA203 / gene_product=unspecified product / transcript_product=unspecified product / location=Mono_scaffold00104:30242-31987(-) / protein_length=582 / sequence_SO=supercontig / SO=protein_coding / is_pseudo=false
MFWLALETCHYSPMAYLQFARASSNLAFSVFSVATALRPPSLAFSSLFLLVLLLLLFASLLLLWMVDTSVFSFGKVPAHEAVAAVSADPEELAASGKVISSLEVDEKALVESIKKLVKSARVPERSGLSNKNEKAKGCMTSSSSSSSSSSVSSSASASVSASSTCSSMHMRCPSVSLCSSSQAGTNSALETSFSSAIVESAGTLGQSLSHRRIALSPLSVEEDHKLQEILQSVSPTSSDTAATDSQQTDSRTSKDESRSESHEGKQDEKCDAFPTSDLLCDSFSGSAASSSSSEPAPSFSSSNSSEQEDSDTARLLSNPDLPSISKPNSDLGSFNSNLSSSSSSSSISSMIFPQSISAATLFETVSNQNPLLQRPRFPHLAPTLSRPRITPSMLLEEDEVVNEDSFGGDSIERRKGRVEQKKTRYFTSMEGACLQAVEQQNAKWIEGMNREEKSSDQQQMQQCDEKGKEDDEGEDDHSSCVADGKDEMEVILEQNEENGAIDLKDQSKSGNNDNVDEDISVIGPRAQASESPLKICSPSSLSADCSAASSQSEQLQLSGKFNSEKFTEKALNQKQNVICSN